MNRALLYSSHGYTASIANRIEKMGVRYETAASEAELIEAAQRARFALIVLDSSTEQRIAELTHRLAEIEMNRLTADRTNKRSFCVNGRVSKCALFAS